MDMERFKPGVPRLWLHRLAGLSWSVVGLWLCALAWSWLRALPPARAAAFAALGLALAGAMYALAFRRVARKNISRLDRLPETACLFAFTSRWGYPLVAFMAVLGYALRRSQAPKPVLAVVYLMVGGGLLAGSIRYYAGRSKT